jgi:hypothetical protein
MPGTRTALDGEGAVSGLDVRSVRPRFQPMLLDDGCRGQEPGRCWAAAVAADVCEGVY